jgi:hypothetical protein
VFAEQTVAVRRPAAGKGLISSLATTLNRCRKHESGQALPLRRSFALADLSGTQIRERMSGNLYCCACYPKI